jgi:hypothetical protein
LEYGLAPHQAATLFQHSQLDFLQQQQNFQGDSIATGGVQLQQHGQKTKGPQRKASAQAAARVRSAVAEQEEDEEEPEEEDVSSDGSPESNKKKGKPKANNKVSRDDRIVQGWFQCPHTNTRAHTP